MSLSLTAAQVNEIKVLRAAGEKLADIAEKYGITFQHVGALCSGRRRVSDAAVDLPGEVWKAVPSIPVLLASNLGRIKRLETERVLSVRTSRNGYTTVGFSYQSNKRLCLVHRLVAEAWLGPCPCGKSVNHKDGKKANNLPGNLEYVSHGENNSHAYNIGLRSARGENNGRAQLTDGDVVSIRSLAAAGNRVSLIAEKYGISKTHCYAIIARRFWPHLV